MARITPSALVDDIKGSVGGVTFTSWKGMTFVRSKARSVRNPATAQQIRVRSGLTYFGRRYFDELSDAQRAAWDQYAQEAASAERSDKVQGGFGSRVVPKRQFQRSGHNWYVAINAGLVRRWGDLQYGSPIDDAPLGQTAPSQPVLDSVVYDGAVGKFVVTLHSPQDFGSAAMVLIGGWIKPNWGLPLLQQSVGVAFENFQIGPFDLTSLLIPRGAVGLPFPDGVYAFQLDAVGLQNGLYSPPSRVVIVGAKYVGP